MSKPIAVLVSDIHYNIHTLPLADAALRQAVDMANELKVPLIVAGDLHDTKANLRGECVQAMIETFSRCEMEPYVLIGNHDLINERSPNNSLEFLRNYVQLVRHPVNSLNLGTWLIPYASDVEVLRDDLKDIPSGSRIIMHQGLNGSESGEYIQDKSALDFEDVKDFRVISGHYHRRQDIKTGRPRKGALGLFSYIGNPYTLGYGEATDPDKGFRVLMDDGHMEFVPTNLRKHIKFELTYKWLFDRSTIPPRPGPGDLLWVKVHGTKEQLVTLTKEKVRQALFIDADFRLDLVPEDTDTKTEDATEYMTQAETLDSLIDSLTSTTDERKARLKELWRKSVCA